MGKRASRIEDRRCHLQQSNKSTRNTVDKSRRLPCDRPDCQAVHSCTEVCQSHLPLPVCKFICWPSLSIPTCLGIMVWMCTFPATTSATAPSPHQERKLLPIEPTKLTRERGFHFSALFEPVHDASTSPLDASSETTCENGTNDQSTRLPLTLRAPRHWPAALYGSSALSVDGRF